MEKQEAPAGAGAVGSPSYKATGRQASSIGHDTTPVGDAQVVDLAAIRARLEAARPDRGRRERGRRGGGGDDTRATPAQPDDERPTILASPRQLMEVRRDALAALRAAEEREGWTIYARRDSLVRLRRDEDGACLEIMTKDAMRGRLTEVARWVRLTRDGGEVSCAPPEVVAADILALAEWPFPAIRRVARAPVVTPAGEIIAEQGYHPDARVYLDLPDDLRGIDEIIPDHPTPDDVRGAVDLLLDGWLGDFPFADQAARAHTLALLLAIVGRDAIAGPVPLHVVDAPQPGTGKSLLVSAVALAATGRLPAAMSEGRDEDEWRKRITAVLMPSPAVVMVDNVRARLDSAALSAVLTTETWEDRLLGQTRMLTLPVAAVFVATGNNVLLSNELARRAVVARLDAQMEQPWLRGGYQRPDLLAWTREQRGVLLAAAYTLVRAWAQAGCPAGRAVLGSYEAWARVVGGILQVAGVEGLLANMDDVYDAADAERREWRALVEIWWQHYGRRPITVGEIRGLLEGTDLLMGVRSRGSEAGVMRALGVALARNRDRVYLGLRIVDAGRDSHRGAAQYALVPVGPDAPPEPHTNHSQRGEEAIIFPFEEASIFPLAEDVVT